VSTLFFPDNTVLVKFAQIGRMDLLRRMVAGNGAWCGSVADECDRSSMEPGLRAMSQAHEIFGEALLPETAQEHVDTQAIRRSFARPGDHKTKHLGEAETIAIISNRRLRAAFVTDDEAASIRANAEGISTYTTWDLLRLAVKVHLITAAQAWAYVLELRGHHIKRHSHLHGEALFMAWCAAA